MCHILISRKFVPIIGHVVLQILEDKAPILDRDTFSVMARIWSPSEWTLNPPFEFTVFHDHSHEVPALLFEKVIISW